jgi:hypothetical protein
MLSFKTVFIDQTIDTNKKEEYKSLLETLNSVLCSAVDHDTDVIVTNKKEDYADIENSYLLKIMDENEFVSNLIMDKIGNEEFRMNKDQGLRDSILEPFFINKGILSGQYSGGTRSFQFVDINVMSKLFNLNFIDPNECQNSSPSNKEFLIFGKKYPFARYHGYVVNVNRDDYRISIEGMDFSASKEELKRIKTKVIKDFKELNNGADELVVSEAEDGSVDFYSWFD